MLEVQRYDNKKPVKVVTRVRRTGHFVIGIDTNAIIGHVRSFLSPFLALPAPPNILHPPTPPPFLQLPPPWWPQPLIPASWLPLTLYGEGVQPSALSMSCTMCIFRSVHGGTGRSNRGAKGHQCLYISSTKRYCRTMNGHHLHYPILKNIYGNNKV